MGGRGWVLLPAPVECRGVSSIREALILSDRSPSYHLSDQLSICRLRKFQGLVAGPSQTLGPEGLHLGFFTPSLS